MIKAEDREGNLVVAPALSEEEWREYRRWHSSALRQKQWVFRCPNCRGQLTPKELVAYGTWFFAHRPTTDPRSCSLLEVGGQSQEHIRLKTLFYKAIKGVDSWRADVEVETDEGDSVLDVLAIRDVLAPDRVDRYGFEVQLSPQDEGTVLNRQEIRERFTARTTWISTKKYSWSTHVPWFRISPVSDPSHSKKRLRVGGDVSEHDRQPTSRLSDA